MPIKKILKAVASALAYLEDAVDAQSKGDEDKVTHLTWRAASNLEYALFLFSLKNSEETRSLSWKIPPSKQPKIESLLACAQDILKEATKSLKSGDQKEAYKKTWIVRGQLFRIHDLFEKKGEKLETF